PRSRRRSARKTNNPAPGASKTWIDISKERRCKMQDAGCKMRYHLSHMESLDFLILGAGIYGLYAARMLARKGLRIVVVECDAEGFLRASSINQARVHNGYHYPRSCSTAIKTAQYFDRFSREFS